MSSKNRVLQILEQKKGQHISGEELAKQLEISRSAVWKAVNELKKDGYQITAVQNRGYCLDPATDRLSAAAIESWLSGADWNGKIHVHQLLESTNATAKQMALDGAPHATVVLAEEQSAGRGRMGRHFTSPKHTGIYMSILLRPYWSVQDSLLVTTAASVAVCRAIEQISSRSAQIKWVNDIYMDGRKVCGILTEAVTDLESGRIESIILGIGVNFCTPAEEFPEELRQKAGSVFTEVPRQVDRNRFAAAVIQEVMALCGTLASGSFLDEYRERSLVLGKPVQVLPFGKEPYPAQAVAIDEQGGLVLKLPDGTQQALHSGEVSIRGIFQDEG